MKNTVEGIKSRLDRAEEWISKLQQGRKKSQTEQQDKKRLTKNKDGLREQQDNMKCNNIHITRKPEEKEEEQWIENMFQALAGMAQ